MAVLVQLPRLPTNCPTWTFYINIQNRHLFKDPIGVFNPHTWPPNLEGVRGSPTATELITIDRQLFYDAMWRIRSFHPTIIRILSDNCASWFSLRRCCDATWYHPHRSDQQLVGWGKAGCARFMWEVRSVLWVLWLHDVLSQRKLTLASVLPDDPTLDITGVITTLQTSLVVVMSCWAVLTAPPSSYHHRGCGGTKNQSGFF